jgi:glycosyltransferase involved in cell wall biosynthesis
MTAAYDKPTVLYLAAGNPVAPRSGMDVVIREHMSELATLEPINLTGIFVAPGFVGRQAPAIVAPWKNFTGFVGDVQNEHNLLLRVVKKIAHVMTGGLLFQYSYVSRSARACIQQELAKHYDLVIVDHALAFANVALLSITRQCERFVFIAHDVSRHAMLDEARLQSFLPRKIYYGLQALQIGMLEVRAIKQASVAAFLSEWDRRHFTWIRPEKSKALCPTLSASRPPALPVADKQYEKQIVFIGSPGFSPNKFALEWIVKELAPRLERIDATITIALVGKGTQQIDGMNAKNIESMGFVSDEELALLLQSCLCVICPVVHGSGIKIKILEAFAAGCPVWATPQSLRGFEFMDVVPQLDIANPAAAAAGIAAFATHTAQQIEARAHVRARWDRHLTTRRGQLNRLVMDALKGAEKI